MKIHCDKCGKSIVPQKIKHKYYSIAVCPDCFQELDLMSIKKYRLLNSITLFIMLSVYTIIVSYFGEFDTRFKFFLFRILLAFIICKLYCVLFDFIVYKIKLF